jgi:hypothetical protein
LATPKIKVITKEDMDSLQIKIRGNVSRMLDFLNKSLGSPVEPNYGMDKVYVYENYVIFNHAVEEYGKLLYLKTLQPDTNGDYTIEYREKFRDHSTKFDLALAELPESIKIVYSAKTSSEATEPTWANRLNVLNTDIDDNGKPTDITFNVDMDCLRKSVFDFRNSLQ